MTDPTALGREKKGGSCCGERRVLRIYRSSYSKSKRPIWVCASFVQDHPTEFEVPSGD